MRPRGGVFSAPGNKPLLAVWQQAGRRSVGGSGQAGVQVGRARARGPRATPWPGSEGPGPVGRGRVIRTKAVSPAAAGGRRAPRRLWQAAPRGARAGAGRAGAGAHSGVGKREKGACAARRRRGAVRPAVWRIRKTKRRGAGPGCGPRAGGRRRHPGRVCVHRGAGWRRRVLWTSAVLMSRKCSSQCQLPRWYVGGPNKAPAGGRREPRARAGARAEGAAPARPLPARWRRTRAPPGAAARWLVRTSEGAGQRQCSLPLRQVASCARTSLARA